MSFCTTINCMDGRVQLPVIEYLKKRCGADYVDTITESGPNLILADGTNQTLVDSILARVDISVNKHGSRVIAVAGHFDCAGNQADQAGQRKHTAKAVEFLAAKYPECEVIGLWVDESWRVSEV